MNLFCNTKFGDKILNIGSNADPLQGYRDLELFLLGEDIDSSVAARVQFLLLF